MVADGEAVIANASASVVRRAAQHCNAQYQALLENEHHDAGKNERGKPLLRVAEEIGFGLYA
jgi:hypothetical protein